MSALNIRTWADVRAFAYVLLPVLSALLVTGGVLNESQASLWAGLATAILGPVIAAANAKSLSTFRAAFYAVVAAVQALLIGYGIADAEQIGMWMPLVSVIVGGAGAGVAEANTSTSP